MNAEDLITVYRAYLNQGAVPFENGYLTIDGEQTQVTAEAFLEFLQRFTEDRIVDIADATDHPEDPNREAVAYLSAFAVAIEFGMVLQRKFEKAKLDAIIAEMFENPDVSRE